MSCGRNYLFVGDLRILISGDILKFSRKQRKKHDELYIFSMGRKLVIVMNSFKLTQKLS